MTEYLFVPTLLCNDKTITDENLSAIEYFKKEGGAFSLVTGRMPYYISHICDAVKPNIPIGCAHGGGLYDCSKREFIWKHAMPDSTFELVEFIDEKFPDVGIQVSTFYETYFCKDNQAMKDFRKVTGLPNLVCHYSELKGPICKIILTSDIDEEILLIRDTLMAHPLAADFDFIRSEKTLFEILPKGISKGVAIKNLVQICGLDINKTIAIGDYNNDISMFNEVKIGIAVSNACKEALEAADYVTVSNEESAVARVIRDLQAGRYVL